MQTMHNDQTEANQLKSGNQEHQRKLMSKLRKGGLRKKNLLENK